MPTSLPPSTALEQQLEQQYQSSQPSYIPQPSATSHQQGHPLLNAQQNSTFSSSAVSSDPSGPSTLAPFGNGSPTQSYSSGDTRTQLFVGNLPFRVRWQDLKDLMRKVGTVLRADVALSQPDGRSRGFGVVLFAHAEDAHKAVEIYNGFSWQTRILDVRLDSQDPTGALAIADANRQSALQQQQQQAQQYQLGNQHQQMQMPMVQPPLNPTWSDSSSGPGQPYRGPSASSTPLLPYSSAASSPITQAQLLSEGPQLGNRSAITSRAGSPIASHRPSPISHSDENRRAEDHLQSQYHQHQPTRLIPPPPPPPAPSADWYLQQQHNLITGMGKEGGSSTGPSYQNYGGPTAMNPYQGFSGPLPPPPPGGNNMMQFFQQSQARPPPNSSNPAQFPNRHIFVGNLPFNAQWQELKDVMRGAGAVLRADIAQGPDGRSRGFGSVLFSSPQDAELAVQMFNGYDYNGRALKVHFDKFSQTNGVGAHPSTNLPPYAPQTQNQHPAFSYDNGYRTSRNQQQQNSGSPFEIQSSISPYHNYPLPVILTSGELPERMRSHLPTPSSDSSPTSTAPPSTLPSPNALEPAALPTARSRPNMSPPTRIAMPPAYPSFGGLFSPTGRPMPMTPGMPAFTLGAFPQTPPLYPSFFSPGLGPFSPGSMGSPYFPPAHFMNAAPGAPVHMQGPNPYLSHNPSPQLESDKKDGGLTQGNPTSSTLLTPPVPSSQRKTLEPTPVSSDEPSYFPPVSLSLASEADEIVPTRSRAGSFITADPSPTSLTPPMAIEATAEKESSGVGRKQALENKMGALKLGLAPVVIKSTPFEREGEADDAGWAELKAASGPLSPTRRKSFVVGGGIGGLSDIRRRFEGDATSTGEPGPGSLGVRRVSFEDSTRSRPRFGSSIWADAGAD